jgi:APA family basic amino acid/polyamine antiporter
MKSLAIPSKVTPVHKGKLLRILGLGFGLAVGVGGTIGVSIFRLPGPIAALLPAPWLILLIWIIGGLYTLLSANYTAELATMLPKAGGPYIYAHRAFGPYAGFIVGWTGWLGDTAALAFLAIAFAEFSTSLFSPGQTSSVTLVAVAVLVLLGALNWIGLRLGSQVQKILSFLKALSLLLFVGACFFYSPGTQTAMRTADGITAAPVNMFTALIIAFQLVLGAYGGWNTVVYFSEEDKDPSHNIPRSLHGGVFLVMVIYVLVVCALLYVLPVHQMATSNLAAADAMQRIAGSESAMVITAIALLSVFGILNTTLLFVPRVLYGLGRDGLFISNATVVNKGGTPTVALLVTVGSGLLLTLLGTFETLMAVYTFFGIANNILLIASLFALRKREPHLSRPYRTWAYPIAPLLLLVISIGLFIAYILSDATNSLIALAALALSYPIFRFITRTNPASGV